MKLTSAVLTILALFVGHSSWATEDGLLGRCEDFLISVKPKFGLASSKHEGFDIRVVGQWGHQSRWSNRELQEATTLQINSTRSSLRRLGFNSSHYLNVLVEKHPGAVNSPVYGEIGTSLSVGALALITTPNVFGVRSLFFGSSKRSDTMETMPRTLVLKALTRDYSSAFSPFSIAHELAHDTEPHGSLRSLIWIEARADFLAFATTGLDEIAWPGEINAPSFEPSGKITVTELSIRRSLHSPQVRKKSDLIANPSAYHENSELISSFLFRIASQFGLETSLQFIRWMDLRAPGELIEVELLKDDHNHYGPSYKQAWGEVVDSFFTLVKKWSTQQSDEKIRSMVLSEIKETSE